MSHNSHQDRLQQLKCLASSCLRDIRKEKRNLKRRQTRLAAGGSSTGLVGATLAVYQMSGCIIDLAAQYWCQERQRRACKHEDCSLQRGRRIVQEWIDAQPLQALLETAFPTTTGGKSARAKAASFLGRAGAAVWATRMIEQHGHAPSTRELWEESARITAEPGDDGAPERQAAGARPSVKSWGWRWRRAWGFRRGKLRVRERYDTEDLREKAGRENVCSGRGFCKKRRTHF